MTGTLVVLRDDLVIYAAPDPLEQLAAEALLAQLDDALPGIRVVLLPGPLDVVDARTGELSALLYEQLRPRLVDALVSA